MAKFRLLALDLDNTLLTKDKRISSENKKWIRRAEAAGVTILFATGRGRQTTQHLKEELDLTGPMVLVNGAEVWAGQNQLLRRYFIEKSDIRYLHDLAVRYDAKFWGYSADSLTKMKDWNESMFDVDWLKFGIRKDDLSLIKQIRKEAQKLPNVEITRSASVNMEVSLKGVSKATGVKKVCEHMNIGMENVMAMGDNLNDLELIKAAGFGVAMENADDVLKDVADAVTTHHEEDGVARAIERYLLSSEKEESVPN